MKNIEKEASSVAMDDIRAILDLFGKLDSKKRELALAALTGMVLAAEADGKGA